MPKSKLPSKKTWNWKKIVTPKKSVPTSKQGPGNRKTIIEFLGLTPASTQSLQSTQSAVVGGRRKSRRKRKQRKSRRKKSRKTRRKRKTKRRRRKR